MDVVLFRVFIILIGFLMLFDPKKARETLRKAGSTNFINYAEITLHNSPSFPILISERVSFFTSA